MEAHAHWGVPDLIDTPLISSWRLPLRGDQAGRREKQLYCPQLTTCPSYIGVAGVVTGAHQRQSGSGASCCIRGQFSEAVMETRSQAPRPVHLTVG